jgi:hypothetical protein
MSDLESTLVYEIIFNEACSQMLILFMDQYIRTTNIELDFADYIQNRDLEFITSLFGLMHVTICESNG